MRSVMKLNDGWKFVLGDFAPRSPAEGWGGAKAKSFYFGMTAANLDDSGWRDVRLPHDFVHEGDYSTRAETFIGADRVPDMSSINSRLFAAGSLPGGIGWYRKQFTVSETSEADKRYFMCFDGVYRNSTVYLNEHFVGNRQSGYTPFSYEVTDYIYTDRENLLAVRVDATEHEGWWYEGGGIYRPVRLIITEKAHIAKDGVFVTAMPETGRIFSEKSDAPNGILFAPALFEISTEIDSHLEGAGLFKINTVIMDGEGNAVCETEDELEIQPWDRGILKQRMNADRVRLWSVDDPYLHTAVSRLYLHTAGPEAWSLIDGVKTSFGVRSLVADADKGLLLNGQPVRVQGVCLHQDHAGVGTALSRSIHEYRLSRIKALGANAVRCSHNNQDPYFFDLCDRMGLLVMDEVRKTSVSEENLSQLRAMVRHDRNHPSIYCWSVGNEEVNLQFTPEAPRVMHTMVKEVRKLDSTRPVTMALVYWDPNGQRVHGDIPVEEMLPLARELDIAGFNYWQQYWEPMHRLLPHKPLMNTEASSGAWTRGCYETNTANAQYYAFDTHNGDKKIRKGSNTVNHNAEECWLAYTECQYLCGYFVWTAFDYRGEPSPMPYPAISTQFGLMDHCGFMKDMAYFFKSRWSKEPLLHVFPDWNREGHEGEALTVYAFSNLAEAELFVNGRSYGRQKTGERGFLQWDGVLYEPGELTAVGYGDAGEIVRKTVRTTGAPKKINLKPFKNILSADDGETAIIDISVTDANGDVAVTCNQELLFTVEGAGEFLGAGNGNPGDHASDLRPARQAFHGLCQLHVRPAGKGIIKIKAEAPGIGTAQCEILSD